MKYQEMPKDLDSEKGIFSLILTDPKRLIEIIDLLKPTDFFDLFHQQIWQAIITLFKDGQEIDLVSIRSQLKKQEADASSAIEALMQCWNETVFNGNLLHFIKAVKNKSILRQIIRITEIQGYSASMDDADAELILQDLEKNILEVTDSTIQGKSIDAEGIINEVDADIIKNKKLGKVGFDTGFILLDKHTGGLIPTQSWIIGAYTGIGKTFFILQILLNVLRQGGKVVLFSTEMDRKINMLRLIGNIANLGTINMIRGTLLDNEIDEMRKAQGELKKYKDSLFIYDNVYTISDIRLKAKKLKLTKGLDIVAVDFIQNLRGGESIYERMSEAAIGLQQLGQELNATMLIGSQVSQASAGWQSKEAIEFKGAGEIAAIADVGLWISKDDTDPNIRKVIIRKIRHGFPAKFEVKLKFPSGQVIDVEIDEKEVKKAKDDTVKDQLKF